MVQISTAEVERDDQDGRKPVPAPHKKAKRSVRSDDEGDPEGDPEGEARLDLSPEKVRQLILTELTVGVEIAGAALGLGRNSAYNACETGQIPSLKIGGKIVVPTAPIRQMLGLEPSLLGAPMPQIAAHPKKQELKKSSRRRRR